MLNINVLVKESVSKKKKKDQELTVAQIIKSLLQNSDLIEEGRENH